MRNRDMHDLPVNAASGRRGHGFSLLELLIAVSLIGGLAAVLLNRFAYYQEAAEKASMEYTISAMRSVLRLRLSELMVTGRVQEGVLLARQNPMEWLDAPPDNYAGRLPNPALGKISPGKWYFDTADGTLIYLVRNGAYFQPVAAGIRRVRLRIVAIPHAPHVDDEGDAYSPVDTVQLQLLEPYQWMKSDR